MYINVFNELTKQTGKEIIFILINTHKYKCVDILILYIVQNFSNIAFVIYFKKLLHFCCFKFKLNNLSHTLTFELMIVICPSDMALAKKTGAIYIRELICVCELINFLLR